MVAGGLLASWVGSADPAHAQARKVAPPKMSNTPNTEIKGSAAAIEGDFLTVGGTPIRLMGIDAPDPGQKCRNRYGREYDCFAISTAVLRNLIQDREVRCVIADKDRNGMNQGECKVDGVDLGAAMVARGWAFAYRALTPAYTQAEAWAQSRRIGMWAGLVEKPWEWRSRRLREFG